MLPALVEAAAELSLVGAVDEGIGAATGLLAGKLSEVEPVAAAMRASESLGSEIGAAVGAAAASGACPAGPAEFGRAAL